MEEECVGQTNQAGIAAHLGYQDSAVALVVLPGLRKILRRDAKNTASLSVQDPAQKRGTIEARHTKPADRSVAAHERRRVSVSDQAVILQGKIIFNAADRSKV